MESLEPIEVRILLNIKNEYQLLKNNSEDSLILQWFKSKGVDNVIRSKETFRQNVYFIGQQDDPNYTGYGIIIYPGQTFGQKVFIGKMKKGVRHGKGFRKLNHQIFMGRYHKNQKHMGAFIYDYSKSPKELLFKGYFYKDRYHGECFIKCKDYIYQGKVSHGLYDGPCEITYSNGDYFKGTMKEGRIQGQGVIKYSNGDVYEGNMKDNKRYGEGSYVFGDSTIASNEGVSSMGMSQGMDSLSMEKNPMSKFTTNMDGRTSESGMISQSGLYRNWDYSTKRPDSEIN